MNSILDLEKMEEYLHENDKSSYNLLKQIYRISYGTGTQVVPDSFRSKTREYFGKRDSLGNLIESEDDVVGRIEQQKIIKIQNKWTGEEALFNSLRADRPGIQGNNGDGERDYLRKLMVKSRTGCDFCQPTQYTPEDVFGRINGKYSVTTANIAKYDVWSSLVIFKNHNPLEFNLDEFRDYLETSFSWFKMVNQEHQSYRFPFFVWNCLSRAGASQVHGHCQIMMSKDPYSRVENLKNAGENYLKGTGSDYFQDIYKAHHILGLSGKHGNIRFLCNLTPVKEKEVMIISSENPFLTKTANETIFKILRCFIDDLEVYSFNLSISCPAMDNTKEFPYIIRIVDRGSLLKNTADIGGMELYGSVVVADDPYKVIESLNEALNKD